jgi:hypothetical protein
MIKLEEFESDRPYGPWLSRGCDVWDAICAAVNGDAGALGSLLERDPSYPNTTSLSLSQCAKATSMQHGCYSTQVRTATKGYSPLPGIGITKQWLDCLKRLAPVAVESSQLRLITQSTWRRPLAM